MSYQSEKTGAKVDELLDKIDALEAATTTTAGLMSAEDKTALNSIAEKFSEGIAKTDLDSGVQTSLGLADTALQSYTETDPTVPAWAKAVSKPTYTATEVGALPDDTVIPDVTGKADKVTSATNGNFAALDSNGNLTDSGHKHSDYLTSHQDISNYVQKSSTAGLLKNDGTVDTSTYITSAHEIPSGGNAGQVLSKNSATDYDVHWVNQTTTYPSAYCTTAAGTATKKAQCTLWTATANTYLHILIGTANTSASALTMNVNSTGAKPIYINGTASSSSNYTLPAGSYIAFYDGTNFYLNTDGTIPRVLHKSSTSGLVKNDGTIDTNTYLTSYTETDPTVPSWAKASSKPSYTAAEVGAVPTTRTVNGKALSTDITLSASDVSALPSSTVIPSAPGTLNTDNSTAQTVSSSEALSGTLKLHKVSKTGSYNDLLNTPTIPTVPTNVSAFINDVGYLTSHQDISGKEDKVSVGTISGTSLSASIGTYYVGSSVGTLAVTLPTVSDATHIASVVLNIATGASPAVTFTAASGVTISYAKDFAIEASKEYEVNCLWNGTKWLVTAVEFS